MPGRKMMPFLPLVSTLLPFTSSCIVEVPCTVPDGSYLIDPSFPNIAVEFSTLASTAQASPNDSSPNTYSINLMKNIFDRTGGIPIIRVGGTSGDYVKYDPDLEAPVDPYPSFESASFVGNLTVGTRFGPNFWPVTKAFDELGAKYVPQLPLPEMNETQIRWQAQAIVDGLGWDKIESIELGNEPEYFPKQDPLGNLTNARYAARFKEYAQIVSDQISPSGPIYQFADTGANVAHPYDHDLNIPGMIEEGVDDDNNINAASVHFYQVPGGPISTLLNHSHTVWTMGPLKEWQQYLANYKDGAITYYIDEANVLSGNRNITIMNGLAGAVWRADYFFYCMTIGIKRVHYEMLFGSYQSNWVSQDTPGQNKTTRAGYYSFLPAADFIGLGGNTKVAQIPVDGSMDSEHLIAYAAYNDTKLARIALVNFNEWELPSDEVAPKSTFKLSGLQGAKKLNVKLLQGNAGSAGLEETITYGGSQWLAESDGMEVTGVQEGGTWSVDVGGDGNVEVEVPYTAVAVAWVQW